MLDAVNARIGVPVVVNTSFNVRGEPIVCSPEDAYNCFARTGIDTLFLGPYVVTEKREEVDAARGYEESDELERQLAAEVRPEGGARAAAPRPTATDASQALARKNPIRSWRDLHRVLSRNGALRILDVGCGDGWLVNGCAIHYPHDALGIDVDRKAIRHAVAVARLGPAPERARFAVADLFTYDPPERFDVVNAIGLLQHGAADSERAIRRIGSWLAPGGHFHYAESQASQRSYDGIAELLVTEGFTIARRRLDRGRFSILARRT